MQKIKTLLRDYKKFQINRYQNIIKWKRILISLHSLKEHYFDRELYIKLCTQFIKWHYWSEALIESTKNIINYNYASNITAGRSSWLRCVVSQWMVSELSYTDINIYALIKLYNSRWQITLPTWLANWINTEWILIHYFNLTANIVLNLSWKHIVYAVHLCNPCDKWIQSGLFLTMK